MDTGAIIALIIVGALAGTAVAAVFGGKKGSTASLLRNTIIGILGALVGGFLFDTLNVNPESGILSEGITLGDFLAAFIGAIIVVFIVDFIGKR